MNEDVRVPLSERAPSRWILTDILSSTIKMDSNRYFVEKILTLLNLREHLYSKLFTAWSSRVLDMINKEKKTRL